MHPLRLRLHRQDWRHRAVPSVAGALGAMGGRWEHARGPAKRRRDGMREATPRDARKPGAPGTRAAPLPEARPMDARANPPHLAADPKARQPGDRSGVLGPRQVQGGRRSACRHGGVLRRFPGWYGHLRGRHTSEVHSVEPGFARPTPIPRFQSLSHTRRPGSCSCSQRC